MDKTLVVMAAGLGSRYGGVKQIERLGPGNEILMEYAICDALAAGFNKLVIIIKQDMLDDMKELFCDRIERRTGVEIKYAIQDNRRFTEDYPHFSGRAKPFGTVHAVLCAKELIDSPFAVVNADDYYGRDAFTVIADELPKLHSSSDVTMVAYRLKNTVSEFGTVTRGVCTEKDGFLSDVKETYKIKVFPDGTIRDTSVSEEGVILDPDCLISMNMWGCHPEMLGVMEKYFYDFLAELSPDEQKAECLLPTMMGDLARAGEVKISVLSSRDRWFGLTYREDKPGAVEALKKLHDAGVYPPMLWM